MSNRDVNPTHGRSRVVYAEAAPVVREEHAESTLTRLIEQQAARVPSDWFLFAALGSMGASLALHLVGRTDHSRFVGMWAPTLLVLGTYNKMVKLLKPR